MEQIGEETSNSSFIVSWKNTEGNLEQGPLNLLWSLIESYKIDIFEVSLSMITSDFIKFIKIAKQNSIELSGEFTKMAAHLVYLKSKALLPDPGFEESEEEIGLPKELIEKLLEHKKFQLAAQRLAEVDFIQSAVFKRESNQTIINFPDDENWLDIDLIDLISAFNSILEKTAVNEEQPNLLLAQSEYTVEEKIRHIEELLKFKNEIYFSEIFSKEEEPETMDIVFSFLALLEIVKQKIAVIRQHKMFGDIKLFKTAQVGTEG